MCTVVEGKSHAEFGSSESCGSFAASKEKAAPFSLKESIVVSSSISLPLGVITQGEIFFVGQMKECSRSSLIFIFNGQMKSLRIKERVETQHYKHIFEAKIVEILVVLVLFIRMNFRVFSSTLKLPCIYSSVTIHLSTT